MHTLRLDNVGVVVTDLKAAAAFFKEIGLESEGEMPIEGVWADRVVGLDGVKSDIVLMRTPDGHGKVELVSYRAPSAVDRGLKDAPSNTLGLQRMMFNVADVKGLVERLRTRHGAELVGEVVDYEGVYELCYMRGPDGIIVALAQNLK